MSTNKFRYYVVNTTSVIRANNQGDAITMLVDADVDVPGAVLNTSVSAQRITADEARQFSA